MIGASKSKVFVFLCFIALDLVFAMPGPNDTTCSITKKKALKLQAGGMQDIYIPSCDEDGFYETGFHCYWNFCFCIINKYTGQRIDADSAKDCA